MTDSESKVNPYVSQIFSLANAFAVPLTKEILGTDRQSAQASSDSLDTRIKWAALNGSGPNDPYQAAMNAPRTLRDFITGGESATSDSPAPKRSGPPMVLIILGVVLAAWFIFKRR
jgi:hypothetical protein